MKEAVTKVIDTLTQENFYGTFQKLLERYNNCITAGDQSFMCVLSIKVPIGKKSGNLFNEPCMWPSNFTQLVISLHVGGIVRTYFHVGCLSLKFLLIIILGFENAIIFKFFLCGLLTQTHKKFEIRRHIVKDPILLI